jgi:hypothetical protein
MVTTEEIYRGSKLARQCENRTRVFLTLSWLFFLLFCAVTFFFWRTLHEGGHVILYASGGLLALFATLYCLYLYSGEREEVSTHRYNASTVTTLLNMVGHASKKPYDARSAAQLLLTHETVENRDNTFSLLKSFGLVGEKYHGDVGAP